MEGLEFEAHDCQIGCFQVQDIVAPNQTSCTGGKGLIFERRVVSWRRRIRHVLIVRERVCTVKEIQSCDVRSVCVAQSGTHSQKQLGSQTSRHALRELGSLHSRNLINLTPTERPISSDARNTITISPISHHRHWKSSSH